VRIARDVPSYNLNKLNERCPKVVNFKHILRRNIVKHFPVTPEDVEVAERTFGPNVAFQKDNGTKIRPIPATTDLVENTPELFEQHHDLIHYNELMFVNGMPMLTGVGKSDRYRTLVLLKNKADLELFIALIPS